MSFRQLIPNLLTLANLFCGCLAIYFLMRWTGFSSLDPILVLFSLCLLLDLLDGMVARLLHVQSEIGKQLDSLADVVSFGVLPGFVAFKMLLANQEQLLSNANGHLLQNVVELLPFVAFLIPIFSAYRLAKFNLDAEQAYYFKGLPTPANAILWMSFFILFCQDNPMATNHFMVIAYIAISCYLLLSNLVLFSFKFNHLSWQDNYFKYIFLLISLLMFVWIGLGSIPMIIVLYIIISIIYRKKITQCQHSN